MPPCNFAIFHIMFEQERMIGRIQRQVLSNPSIRVCFLSGSYGRRTEDDYSDIDVALVFRDKSSRDMAWRERAVFVKDVMPYVPVKAFDGEHIRPFLYISLFSNGSKVDWRFETESELKPNPWDANIRILKDNSGWGETFQQASAYLAFPQPRITAEELAALDNQFWVMFWDALRLLKRGDIDKPFTIYLEMLQFTLPSLLRALPPEDDARRGLLIMDYGRDAKKNRKQMAALLDAYLAARSAIISRYNLAFFPNQGFETEIKRLVQKLV